MGNELSESDVVEFLCAHHGGNIVVTNTISHGHHSEVFVYGYGDAQFVLRLNNSDEGFYKDVYAAKHFASDALPIPQVIAVGEVRQGLYFCISEFVSGHSVRDEYNRDEYTSFATQFKTIETLRTIPVPMGLYGDWNEGGYQTDSLAAYLEQLEREHDWERYAECSYVDLDFVSSLRTKYQALLPSCTGVTELVHGDFGNHNLLLQVGKVAGVLDWAKSHIGDAFFDVARVVLYCPRRDLSVQAALDFYAQNDHKSYKERIMTGVYFTMLINYGFAARAGNETSCQSAAKRVEEIERVFWS